MTTVAMEKNIGVIQKEALLWVTVIVHRRKKSLLLAVINKSIEICFRNSLTSALQIINFFIYVYSNISMEMNV
jgi:hypothetical protein